MNWINIKDKLPTLDEEEVLVVFIGWDDLECIRVLDYNPIDNEWFDWKGNTYTTVTHWMPLPELPKE